MMLTLPILLCGSVVSIGLPLSAVAEVVLSREAPEWLEELSPHPRPAHEILAAQARALLAGDRNGWLKPVSAQDPELRQRYRDIFENLRGLGVTRFDPLSVGNAPGEVKVSIDYCLGSGHCCLTSKECRYQNPNSLDTPPRVRWAVTFAEQSGAMRITGLRVSTKDEADGAPTPWEIGPLIIQSDDRVIVAAPPAMADLVPQVLAEAKSAAPVIDGYAQSWGKPLRYLIYLADSAAFTGVWFGGQADADTSVAGYAFGHRNQQQYEVVLEVPFGLPMENIVRHEMAHVSTLDASPDMGEPHLWLAEGLAEYIVHHGRPVTANPRMAAVKDYVAGGWSGDLTDPRAAKSGDQDEIPDDVDYSLGHLAVACLAEQRGREAMLTFFKLVVREGGEVAEAGQTAFGEPWEQTNKRCADHIRRQLK